MSTWETLTDFIRRFFGQRSRPYLLFQVLCGAVALHAFVTGLAILLSPESAMEPFLWLGVTLGGMEYPASEHSYLWRSLAAVETWGVGFMAAFLQLDIRRRWPVLWPLAFMKTASSAAFLVVFIGASRWPAFWALGLRDAVLAGAVLYLAFAARKDAEKDESDLVPRPLGFQP
ncbi:MAG: hypothetical protein WC943_01945 [Elusimicrobiota bacterium]|jgi:hypothetical protein